MLQRLVPALVDPSGFFRWLATRPERRLRAYAVLLVGALVSNGVVLWAATAGDLPQGQPMRDLIARSGLPTNVLLMAWVAAVPLGAALTWAIVWVLLRVGGGPAARLWEVAGWSQLPQVAIALANAGLLLVGRLDPAVSAFLGAIGVAWCAWFVWAGERELARGRAVGAVLVYALFWAIPVGIAWLAAGAPAPTPSPDVVM